MRTYKAQSDRLDGMQALNLELARCLSTGDMLYSVDRCNADGTAMRAKVTSVKTWKKDTSRISIGYKHGLYDYGKLDAYDLPCFRVDQHTYDRLVMRANGFISHNYRRFTSHSTFTRISGWYHPTKHIQQIGDITINAPLADTCQACGTIRSTLANELNPYPQMCTCGIFFDPSVD